MNAPICTSETVSHAVARYRHCPTCTHAFFGRAVGGAGYDDDLSDGDLLRKRGRMLDVGAAAGFLLAGFADRG